MLIKLNSEEETSASCRKDGCGNRAVLNEMNMQLCGGDDDGDVDDGGGGSGDDDFTHTQTVQHGNGSH